MAFDDFIGIDPAGALIGDGGIKVAVQDEDVAAFQSRDDDFADVLLSIGDKEFKLFVDRNRTAVSTLP